MRRLNKKLVVATLVMMFMASMLWITFSVEADPGTWVDQGIVYGEGEEKAYYPTVIYDGSQYLMLYDEPASYATSPDGLTWTEGGTVSGLTNPSHMVMLYDEDGFSGSYNYKLWYFDEGADVENGVDSIRYAESNDGINWENDQAVFGGNMESYGDDKVDAPSRTWGPGTVLYNEYATNTGDDPMDYSYVMYYDGYNGNSDDTEWDLSEALFLAYSSDGINWNRYTTSPVLKGSSGEWDDGGVGYPTVMERGDGSYIVWYGGGPGTNQGIGVATSPNGISWTKDPGNPIFHISDGKDYRASRTYTPRVLVHKGKLRMYYSAKSDTGDYAIGLATASRSLLNRKGRGPAEKATGDVWTTNDADKRHHFWFNAHENKDGRAAKGMAYLRNYLGDPEEYDVNRALDIEVDTVEVDGNKAMFSGIVIYDNFDPSHPNYRVGERLYFYVEDGGTPGRNGDVIEWGWSSGIPLSYTGDIYEGNLVVHS
ncbi:MAG: hypothetical protein ACOC6G_00845 [Thermoproteota archaeon]